MDLGAPKTNPTKPSTTGSNNPSSRSSMNLPAYLRDASGSIPRSILATRSRCRTTIMVIATAQPPMIPKIGISSGPKLRIDSMPHLQQSVFGQRRTTNSQRQFSGGADRDRTGGLLVANQALSQLSYSPVTQLLAFSR